MIQKSLKLILMGSFLAFLGCKGDINKSLESRSLIRHDITKGVEILDEFENIDGGDVEVCVSGPLGRDEDRSCYYISKSHYEKLCEITGERFEYAGYSSKSSPKTIRRLRVIVMDDKMQRIVNKNYSLAK